MIVISGEQLIERFLRFVAVDTTADPSTDNYPSSPGQLVLAKMLVHEMTAMGVTNPHQDENGLVWGELPRSTDDSPPTVALCAHLDTRWWQLPKV